MRERVSDWFGAALYFGACVAIMGLLLLAARTGSVASAATAALISLMCAWPEIRHLLHGQTAADRSGRPASRFARAYRDSRLRH